MVRWRDATLTAARWLVLAIPLAEVVLELGDVLSLRAALITAVVLEILLAAVLVAEFAAFRHAAGAARAQGAGRLAAATAGLHAAVPPPVAWLMRTEAGMVRALRRAVRRRSALEPGDVALPYTSRIGVLLGGGIGIGIVELVVVHVLLPWPLARWLLFGVSVYTLLWLLALSCSLRQHPHVVRDGQLLVRFGHLHETAVPLDTLAAVRARTCTEHERNLILSDGELTAAVLGETSVELSFDPPVQVAVKGRISPVSRLSFFADDPRAAVTHLRERVAAV